MSRFSKSFVPFIFLTACGPDLETACNDYLDAQISCLEEAYGDDDSVDTVAAALDGTCDVYDGMKGSEAKEAATILECYADTIDAADCSDIDAYSNAVLAMSTDCI